MVSGIASSIGAILKYVLYFPQHLLQIDVAEYGIDATITNTGNDSIRQP